MLGAASLASRDRWLAHMAENCSLSQACAPGHRLRCCGRLCRGILLGVSSSRCVAAAAPASLEL